jgi:hypothetical protein
VELSERLLRIDLCTPVSDSQHPCNDIVDTVRVEDAHDAVSESGCGYCRRRATRADALDALTQVKR